MSMYSKETQVGKRSKPKRGNHNKIPDKVRQAVFERDENKCIACKDDWNKAPHHIDPIGSDYANHSKHNLVTLCFNCHRSIHDNPEEIELRTKVYEYMSELYPEYVEFLYEHLIAKYERKGF